AYQALNIDPGRRILEQLANDYQNNRAWRDVNPMTKGYMERVAQRVLIVKNAGKRGAPPPPAVPASAASPDSDKPVIVKASLAVAALFGVPAIVSLLSKKLRFALT